MNFIYNKINIFEDNKLTQTIKSIHNDIIKNDEKIEKLKKIIINNKKLGIKSNNTNNFNDIYKEIISHYIKYDINKKDKNISNLEKVLFKQLININNKTSMQNSKLNIKREQKLGNSKMDFKINNNCYIEVKSPLQHLNTEIPDYIKTRKKVFLYDGNRLIKHCIELTKSLKKSERAIMLITFQYDSNKFDDKSKAPSKNSEKIKNAVYKFIEFGGEIWQVNLSIDSKGVKFLKSFPIDV
jgi:hypothetical protein